MLGLQEYKFKAVMKGIMPISSYLKTGQKAHNQTVYERFELWDIQK